MNLYSAHSLRKPLMHWSHQ